MRGVSVFGLVVGVIILGKAGGVPGAAQEANPPGSYQQSCSDISVKKGNLYAKCQDDKGKNHSAKLSHYEKCSDIVNKNGSLHCNAGSEDGKPSLPRGSYTDSCHDITMKGNTLHAICKSADGREAPATLKDAGHCAQGVANVNGVLSCEVSDVLPPGSYISTCKDIRMQRTTLMASCDNGKGRSIAAELRDAHKCTGDIMNQNGKLKCTPIKKVERR
jgi:hypothetical protein